MKKQPYPILELTGGLNVSKDPMLLMDKENPRIYGMRHHEGFLKKDVGMHSFATLEGIPMFIDSFYKYDGSEYTLLVTDKWIYEYIDSTGEVIKRNPIDDDVLSGDITATFATDHTITRSTGSFVTDGFAEGDTIITSSSTNPGPFVIDSVEALVITVVEDLTNESPDTFAVSRLLPLTGTQDYAFSSTQTFLNDGADVYFLTNGLDPVLQWSGSGQFTLTDFYCKQLSTYSNMLLMGYTIESGNACPTRFRWSVPNNPLDHSGTGSGYSDLVDTPDWLTAIIQFRDKIYVIKERSIWEMVWVGGTVYFLPALKLDGVGSAAPNSIISLGEDIIFYGNDDIYLYDGVTLKGIGGSLFSILYDTEKKIVASAFINRAVAVYVEELKEYWLALPTTGENTSILLKYNFDNESWIPKEIEVTALGYYSISVKPLWRELTGAWAAQTWIWMDRFLPAGAPTTLIGVPDGTVYEDDRITRDQSYAVFETKDWAFAHGQRWREIHFEARKGAFSLSYSLDQGVTWSIPVNYTSSDEFVTYVLFLNSTSKSLRLRCECRDYDLEVKWIEPWYIPRARTQVKVGPTS